MCTFVNLGNYVNLKHYINLFILYFFKKNLISLLGFSLYLAPFDKNHSEMVCYVMAWILESLNATTDLVKKHTSLFILHFFDLMVDEKCFIVHVNLFLFLTVFIHISIIVAFS